VSLTGLIHHSDRGVQYLAIRYTERLAEAGVVPSVGSRGDSYDSENGTGRHLGSSLTRATIDHGVLALIRRLDAGVPSGTLSWAV
jgi:transposase InsO family protein